jgi:glycosyltransferase involved in cell wall biosynthesis
VLAFARWCRQQHIAVVHTTTMPANIFGLPAAALAGVPVRIGNRRELNPDKSGAAISLQRCAYALAHTIIANSRAAADRLESERVPRRKIAVVPNGLDVDTFTAAETSRPPRRVIVVANLRPEKGHRVLLDAAAILVRQFPDARFEFVGGGPELEPLLARAAALRIDHACDFLGHRDDVPARLRANDIFVLPSRSEAFPNAVLEAMAAGLPVVCSAVGGILELVDDGRTGVLVPPDDPAAFAARIGELMANGDRARELGREGRRDVEARFSFERMVAASESVYLRELTRRGVLTTPTPEMAVS